MCMRRCARIITDDNGVERAIRVCMFASMPSKIGKSIYVRCTWRGFLQAKATKNQLDCSDFYPVKERLMDDELDQEIQTEEEISQIL